MQFQPLAASAVVAVLALAFCGCGSDLATVTGTVTCDGQPLEGMERGGVTFHPVGQGALGIGQLQSDGSFTVQTGTQKGLAPGEYVVTVVATGPTPQPTPENPEPLPDLVIPAKYGSVDQSGLRYTIGKSGEKIEIDLKSE